MNPSVFKSDKVGNNTVAKKVPVVVNKNPSEPVGYSRPDFSSGIVDLKKQQPTPVVTKIKPTEKKSKPAPKNEINDLMLAKLGASPL